MTRVTKIIRETKEQGKVSTLPVEKTYTFQNANEDVSKINQLVDMQPIFLKSDVDGKISGSILDGIHIGAIFQLGSSICYAEYDGTVSQADEFSKDLDETTIKQAGTHIDMIFLPLTKYKLDPR